MLNLADEIAVHLDTGFDSPDERLDVRILDEIVGLAGHESVLVDEDRLPVRRLLSGDRCHPDDLIIVADGVGECHSLLSVLLLDADGYFVVQDVDTPISADTGDCFVLESYEHGSITF